MAKPRLFIDPETGARRQREQRPDGIGTKCRIQIYRDKLLPDTWEMYRCMAEGCPYSTQWSEEFDMHYFHKHEIPEAQERACEDAIRRAAELAERQKPRVEIPILKRSF